ncbi:MAG: response regulator [Psychrilyobacter sp.]|uniref:response regulator n=1 Tax=Psychrilyobacter sp. TaxID=2586924 RepID=UPI003C77E550
MKKVLVIDDELSIRLLLREIIEDLYIEVSEAETAIVGLQMIEKQNFDLIIMDIQMPQMNGLDAMRKLRELTDAPVFILTAFSHLEEVVENLGVEIQGFVEKPFDIDELAQKIKKQVE